MGGCQILYLWAPGTTGFCYSVPQTSEPGLCYEHQNCHPDLISKGVSPAANAVCPGSHIGLCLVTSSHLELQGAFSFYKASRRHMAANRPPPIFFFKFSLLAGTNILK